ncbi:hypothetical protein BDI4_500014 [Burkholderia diffusa]|nr:hypothetical protein BDI4_500014 [Burkholderia diffusa]
MPLGPKAIRDSRNAPHVPRPHSVAVPLRVHALTGLHDDRVHQCDRGASDGELPERPAALSLVDHQPGRRPGHGEQRPHGRHGTGRMRGAAGYRIRVRRCRRATRDHARPSVDAAPLRAHGAAARQPVHGHLCAREVGAARGLCVRDPLGKHVGAEGRVSGHALPEGTVRDRPRPHHVHGRRRAARHDAEPDRRARGHRARHADRRAVHRRTRARHERATADAARRAARLGEQVAVRGDLADGEQHRGAAVARGTRTTREHVAAPAAAPVPRASRDDAHALLPDAAAAPRARVAAADRHVDHAHHDGVRLPVGLPLQQELSRCVRCRADARAPQAGRTARAGRGGYRTGVSGSSDSCVTQARRDKKGGLEGRLFAGAYDPHTCISSSE